MQNILITSAGRRGRLIEFFKNESKLINSSVYASDIKPEMSAACQLADESFKSPKVKSNDFVPYLLDLSRRENIGVIIPTIDTELIAFARHREEFLRSDISLVISDMDFVQICRNKLKTSIYFNSIGISTPEIFDNNNIKFPCFVKPLDGSSSIGARIIETRNDVTEDLANDKNMIFMEYIGKEYQEYTVDAYYDRAGVLRCFVPRIRLETRAGEVSKSITRKDKFFDYLNEALNAIKGARGCVTFQFFVNLDNQDFKAIEINPRFGGGFPLSYAAGANYPKWIIKEYLLSQKLEDFEEWDKNLMMLRYDAEVIRMANDQY